MYHKLICTVKVCIASIPIFHCLLFHQGYAQHENRLEAVQKFAEQVLLHARDNYRDEPTPLFADGLRLSDRTAVQWLHKGENWIPSNLANQQNLFRTFVGLSALTGDEKYRHAAKAAVDYGFNHFRHKNGLMYWGGHRFFDLSGGKFVGEGYRHEFKFTLPYYEFLREVNQEATDDFIRALWNAHILDWKNLDMNRHGAYEDEMGNLWDNVFEQSPPFFEGKGLTFINAGTDLIYAGLILYQFTGDKGALDWSKRLAYQYVQARHPKTGLGVYQYSKPIRERQPPAEGPLPTTSNYGDRAENQFGARFGEVALEGYMLRSPASIYGHNAIIQLQMSEKLGDEGKELLSWTIDGLKAWLRYGYDPENNTARALWANGTDMTGYVIERDGYYGKAGTVFKADPLPPIILWSSALAYCISGDKEIWKSLRSMMQGFDLGDPGKKPGKKASLNLAHLQSDPLLLFAVLELCRLDKGDGYKALAIRLGDNILQDRFHDGFFIPGKDHIYASVNAIEPLALLALEALLQGKEHLVPQYNSGKGYFHGPHDHYGRTTDQRVFWDAKKE
jgi:pectate lyase